MNVDEHGKHSIPDNWPELFLADLQKAASIRSRDKELADDAVQETFLVAIQKIGQFEGRGSLRCWLMAILDRKLIDCYRKKERAQLASVFGDDMSIASQVLDSPSSIFATARSNPSPSQVAEFHEIQQVLERGRNALSFSDRKLFEFKFTQSLPSEEICEMLGISVSALHVRVHRLRKRLEAELDVASKLNSETRKWPRRFRTDPSG